MTERSFPAVSGSYLLWLYLPRATEISVGRLGRYPFRRGWYFYCGSAFGPGGLRARLGHHLRPSVKRHWHIDYLKEWAGIRAVWLCRGSNCEHDWSQLLAELENAERPLPGFGSSDCECRSHLLYLPKKPAAGIVRNLLTGDCRIERYNLPGGLSLPLC